MSVVAEPRAAERVETHPSRLHLRIFDDVAAAAPAWDALEAKGGGSAYQSRRFLEPWIAHVAPSLGIIPRLGLVSGPDDEPMALLPFGATRHGPLNSVVYLGARDSNLNLPLLAPNAAISPDEARLLLKNFGDKLHPRPDLFLLSNAPRMWNGQHNPLVLANAPLSPSTASGSTLGASVDEFLVARQSKDMRKKLRTKAARLATLGPVSVERAQASDAPGIVTAFIAQKEAQLAARGVAARLSEPHVQAFLTALAAPRLDGEPVLDLYVLRVGATIAAVFGGLAHGRHWHGLINSYADDQAIARCSPGVHLLHRVLADLGRRGFAHFDLGIGEARYKGDVCDETIELFDVIVPLTGPGFVFAAGEALRRAVKRQIKQTPWAFNAARRLRANFARR